MMLLLLPVLSIVLTVVMVIAAFRTRKKMIRAIDEMLGSITDRFINAINDPMSDPPPQQASTNQGRRMAGAAAGGALGGILMADRAMQMVNRYSSDTNTETEGDQVDVDATQADTHQGNTEQNHNDMNTGDTAVTNDQAAQEEAEKLKASGGITGAKNTPSSTDKTGTAESISTDVISSNEKGVANAGTDSAVDKQAKEDAGKIQREHATKAVVHTGEAVAGAYTGDADMAARGAAQAASEMKQAGDKETAKEQAKKEIRSGEDIEHGISKGTADGAKDIATGATKGAMPGASMPADTEDTANTEITKEKDDTDKKVIHGTEKQGSKISSKPKQNSTQHPAGTADKAHPSVPKATSPTESATTAPEENTMPKSEPAKSGIDVPPVS